MTRPSRIHRKHARLALPLTGLLSALLVGASPAHAATLYTAQGSFLSAAPVACGIETTDFEYGGWYSGMLLWDELAPDHLAYITATAGLEISPTVDNVVNLVRDDHAALVRFDPAYEDAMDVDGALGDEDLPYLSLYMEFDAPVSYFDAWFIGASAPLSLTAWDPYGNTETLELPVTGMLVAGGVYAGVTFDNPKTYIEITSTLQADEFAVDDLGLAPLGCFDQDGDGYRPMDGDCDDLDASSSPGAPEECNGYDDNCDGALAPGETDENFDEYLDCEDTDLDGYAYVDGDCDPWDPTVYPGAPELCDGIDNDCDDVVESWDSDLNHDEYLDCVDTDGDGIPYADGDCDPWDPTVYPGAPELCDGIDNDCNDVVETWDQDLNFDAYPDCVDTDGDGVSYADGDCDPWNPYIFPGAEELCDGIDNDCDGIVPDDEIDLDKDGYSGCEGDEEDEDPEMHPYHEPRLTNGVDHDYTGEAEGRTWGCAVGAGPRSPAGGAVMALLAGLWLVRRRGSRPVTRRRKPTPRRTARPAGPLWLVALLFVACSEPNTDGPASGTTAEPPPQEEICNDQLDNDRNGLVDCNDPACDDECDPDSESECDDQYDNDADGDTDCEDPDCRYDASCVPDHEDDCSNGLDDDLDGWRDCEDEDCFGTPECEDPEEDCLNGLDDDLDGLIDCDDPDCVQDSECTPDEEQDCSDGLDDDSDGDTDCDDPDCWTDPICWGSLETDCSDGLDDDGDGAVDCEDGDCVLSPDCAPENVEISCADLVDNDADGWIDCADPDCVASPACNGGGSEFVCDDGFDNDGDGTVDCADVDCGWHEICAPTCPTADAGSATGSAIVVGTTLGAGQDPVMSVCGLITGEQVEIGWTAPSTGDYTVDTEGSVINTVLSVYEGGCGGAELTCNDNAVGLWSSVTFSATAGQDYLLVVAGFGISAGDVVIHVDVASLADETGLCFDGIDNDQDGRTDCDDYDCASDCTSPEDCSSGLDEDYDGMTDCSDPDCATELACDGECPQIDLGQALGIGVAYGTTVGLLDGHPVSACGVTPAPDVSFRWSAPSTSTWRFVVDGDFDTVLTVADFDCDGDELACNDDAFGALSEVTYGLQAGGEVILTIDGYGYAEGDYLLSIEEWVPADEDGLCSDGLDNDGDASVDCSDADCTTAPACSVTEICNDAVDNDGDGLADCDDEDCDLLPVCNLLEVCPRADLGSSAGFGIVAGDNLATGDQLGGSACGAGDGNDFSFGWTAPRSSTYQFDTQGSSFDTQVSILEGSCDGAELACNDDADGTPQSRVTVDLLEGDSVVVAIDSIAGEYGAFELSIHDPSGQTEVGLCDDGVDNDLDGPADCSDSDCAEASACTCCAQTEGQPGCPLNPTVESCVCAAMPSCCTGEWDWGCVAAIESYSCGVCP